MTEASQVLEVLLEVTPQDKSELRLVFALLCVTMAMHSDMEYSLCVLSFLSLIQELPGFHTGFLA